MAAEERPAVVAVVNPRPKFFPPLVAIALQAFRVQVLRVVPVSLANDLPLHVIAPVRVVPEFPDALGVMAREVPPAMVAQAPRVAASVNLQAEFPLAMILPVLQSLGAVLQPFGAPLTQALEQAAPAVMLDPQRALAGLRGLVKGVTAHQESQAENREFE